MTTFLLIRHASNDTIGKAITGRNAGIHLNPHGLIEAEALAQSLQRLPIAAIYTSPLERARETAAPLARCFDLPLCECEQLNEVHFGEWSGLTFEELHALPEWHRFNRLRSVSAAPGGESMLEVQARVIAFMRSLRDLHAHQTIALVTHSDVIKAALVHFLGTPLDLFQRIEISPASISTVELADSTVRIAGMNQRTVSCPT